jgi:RNA-binding protein
MDTPGLRAAGTAQRTGFTAFRKVPSRVRHHYNGRMNLSEKQKKHLRRLAHPLHPIVMLGNAGLSDAVVAELDRALNDHELVKVSARVGARTGRDASLDELARRTSAVLVQRVGHVGVFYRRSERLSRILVPDE